MKEKEYSLDDAYPGLDMNNLSRYNNGNKFVNLEEVMKKSIIQEGYDKLERDPTCYASTRQQKLQQIKEKKRTKGPDWFNMKNTKMTKEVENDLRVLHMRSVLDPKHFYKKNDVKGLPKYFQVGKYVDSPEDFYSSRIPKKERRRTVVEELMADAEFVRANKKKAKARAVVAFKRRTAHDRAHRHSKRLKKNKNRRGGK